MGITKVPAGAEWPAPTESTTLAPLKISKHTFY